MKYNHKNFFTLSFSITILLSSFLLFLIQPLIGKYILPWFGGTSFVWITSLLFFQTLLLGGYLYSFLLTKLATRKQLAIHATILFSSILLMLFLFSQWSSPITPAADIKLPDMYSPALQVLLALMISVGLPYFLLSTTSTLLQYWFGLFPKNQSPYPLYALSNVGSLVAIAVYPFLIEPFFPLQLQGEVWSWLFIILCFLLLFCTWQVFHKHASYQAAAHKQKKAVTKTQIFYWLFLPAVSSIVLLSGTHQLTQGIAPIPFLWLLPLGLYLISFILAFSERPFYKPGLYAYAFLLAIPVVLSMMIQPTLLGVLIEFCYYLVLLFSCFMLCHGELFAKRPSPEQLNIFYLTMATGSVIGSIIVALIAPVFFVGLFWEFLLGLFLATLIAVLVPLQKKQSFLYKRLAALSLSANGMKYFLIAVVTGFYIIFGLGVMLAQYKEALGIWRNYYGTIRVIENPEMHTRCLLNGKIIHGCQSTKNRKEATVYYGEQSIGNIVTHLRRTTKQPLTIGVLGLGVGTIATYGKKDDVITFYELNPLDVAIATSHFTYLKDTPAFVKTVIGDGRLSLEKELRNNEKHDFNLFVVDAFNDDAIPVHLLTKEAFATYLQHMNKKGIIAVHISNTYLDLAPVVKKVADYYDMHLVFIDAPATNDLQTKSKWALLSHDKDSLSSKELQKNQTHSVPKDIQLWTDTYSNLFQIVTYFPK